MQIVNTYLIGKIRAVRRIEVDGYDDNGDYKNGMPKVQVTFESESFDDNGDIAVSMDNQIVDSTEYQKYKSLEHKVVGVPYLLTKDKKDKWEVDKNMPFVEMKDTFINLTKQDKSSTSQK